jgi:hypothetical protein
LLALGVVSSGVRYMCGGWERNYIGVQTVDIGKTVDVAGNVGQTRGRAGFSDVATFTDLTTSRAQPSASPLCRCAV